MKKTVKIVLTAIFLIGIITFYSFQVPYNSPLHDAVLNLARGIILGSIVTVFLFLKKFKKLEKSNSLLSKDAVRLADEKRRANYLAATYLTEKNALEHELNELKNFRVEICDAVKKLASDMEKFLIDPVITGESILKAFGNPLPGGRIPYTYKLPGESSNGPQISRETEIKQSA